MANKKQKREYKTLLAVLANGSAEKASALLKKYSGETAQNPQDLQVKLARLYAVSPSKLDLEKEFAEIHPHKDFILKYTKPKVELQPLQPEVKEKVATEEKKMIVVDDGYSNASGGGSCPCQKCAGGYSNASGDTVSVPQNNNTAMVVFGAVAVVGMILYFSNKK